MSHSEAYKKFGEYDKFWGNGHGKVNVIDYLQDSLNPFFNNQTNWWDYAFRKGEITYANLQASGGSKRFTYMMGAGWFAETGIMNSCNPVFIELGEKLGVENFYKYFSQFGLLSKTNVDLPGEAATIMHKKENVGPVELATISFGQSFQITPMQLVTTVSSIINGGHRITPHFGVKITGEGGKEVETLRYETKNDICTKETSETMRYLLERVVSDGSGKNAKIEGFSFGGITATSQTLPRSDHKYISSFLGFAPADDPKVLVLVVINDPKGTYYGGQIAAPVAKEIMENILPYLAK